MSESELLFEIIEALEEEGLERDEYQLGRVVDIESLQQVVDSANTDLEISFCVGEFRVLITGSEVCASPPSCSRG